MLDVYRAAWEAKPVLRAIYQDLYERMAAACKPGRTLEIGGGSGNLKSWLPDVVSTDIQCGPWLDAVCDAHILPFADRSFDNVVLFDVLHHLARPKLFLDEAARVLKPGGRLVMMEPCVTPVSWVVNTLLHPEPIHMDEDPLATGPLVRRDPYEANQGIPTILFLKAAERFAAACPDLRLVSVKRLSLFAYPLSGGFRRWQLLPLSWVRPLLALEDRLLPLLGRLFAYCMLAVVERR